MATIIDFCAALAARRGQTPAPVVNDWTGSTCISGRDIAAIESNIARTRAEEQARQAEVAKGHWTGSKYVSGRDIAEIAKEIRRDIAAAIKSGALPAIKSGALPAIKTSVRISRYSMGHSIDVYVTAVPAGFPVANPERVRFHALPHREQLSRQTPVLLSDEMSAVLRAIEDIANAYNFDKSDTMTDYYNQAFACSVELSPGIRSADAERLAASMR